MIAYDRPDELPDVLQLVVMRLARTSGPPVLAPTRVLDLEVENGSTRVVVSCPTGCDPKEHHFEAALTWTQPSGRLTRPVTAHPARRRYGPVWVLDATGPTLRAQERRHFRARLTVPVRILWEAPPVGEEEEPEERRCDAVTIDVSECGALALVHENPPEIGSLVDTILLIDGTELEGPATVVRHVPFPGGIGIGVMFPEHHRNADRLRRAAFDAERRRVSRGVR